MSRNLRVLVSNMDIDKVAAKSCCDLKKKKEPLSVLSYIQTVCVAAVKYISSALYPNVHFKFANKKLKQMAYEVFLQLQCNNFHFDTKSFSPSICIVKKKQCFQFYNVSLQTNRFVSQNKSRSLNIENSCFIVSDIVQTRH